MHVGASRFTGPAGGDAPRPRPVTLRAAPASVPRQDSLALAGVAVGMALLPILRPAGPGNLGPADIGIFLAIGALLLSSRVSRQVLHAPYLLPVAVMVLAGLMSAVGPGAGILTVVQDLYLLLWAIVIANVARSPRAAAFVVRAWCATAGLWAAILFVVVGRSALSTSSGAVRVGFTADTNGAGLYFTLSLFVIVAARWPRRLRWRVPAIALLLFDTVLTGSLGALSGLLAGMAVALVFSVAGRRGMAAALVLFIAMSLAGGSAVLMAQRADVIQAAHQSSNLLIRNSIGRGDQSSAERTELGHETLALASRSALWGRGPSSTESLLRAEQAPYVKQAHNDWFAAVIERGFLGLAGFLLLVGEVVVYASRTWHHDRLRAGYGAVLPRPQYVVGGLVVLLIFSLTHEVLHDRTAWTLLGVLAAAALWTGRGRRAWGRQ